MWGSCRGTAATEGGFSITTVTKRARALRKNATPWENKLWYQFLRTYPVKFRRQQPIDNYIVDFYSPPAKLIVELDGGGHYYQQQMQYDKQRTAYLEEKGYKVIRFTNLDVDKNFYGVCTVIDLEVKKRCPSVTRKARATSPTSGEV